MKDVKTAAGFLLVVIIAAVMIPMIFIGIKAADLFTSANLNQLIGGFLTICGAGIVLLALIVGGALAVALTRRLQPRASSYNVQTPSTTYWPPVQQTPTFGVPQEEIKLLPRQLNDVQYRFSSREDN